MLGINEVLNKVINEEPLTKEEKFNLLHSKRIDHKIIKYLKNKLKNLYIEVLGYYEGSIFKLMSAKKLEGWCWETTESAIVFFNDDDYIERGSLKFNENNKKYYHSWICFKFKKEEYVLDPCLNFLCKKEDYSKIFDIEVKSKVTAKAVREELIRQLTAPKEKDDSEENKKFEIFWNSFLKDLDYKEEKINEVVVHAPEDVNTPLYRNGAGYRAEIQNKKIKKLIVHYYYTDF